MDIRLEAPGDRAVVRSVHLASFPGAEEADLVDRLRADGDAVLSLVADDGGTVVGHALFSRMSAPFRALGLGPVAVLPDRRRRGIAARLIGAGIARAADAGWEGVFVLGDPRYYRRFGFDAAHAAAFESVYAGPCFMALPLARGDLPVRTGRIDYAPAFSALG